MKATLLQNGDWVRGISPDRAKQIIKLAAIRGMAVTDNLVDASNQPHQLFTVYVDGNTLACSLMLHTMEGRELTIEEFFNALMGDAALNVRRYKLVSREVKLATHITAIYNDAFLHWMELGRADTEIFFGETLRGIIDQNPECFEEIIEQPDEELEEAKYTATQLSDQLEAEREKSKELQAKLDEVSKMLLKAIMHPDKMNSGALAYSVSQGHQLSGSQIALAEWYSPFAKFRAAHNKEVNELLQNKS